MTNHTLTIGDDRGNVLLNMAIPPIDPMHAVPAILAALSALPKPKKPRADKGAKRTPTAVLLAAERARVSKLYPETT